MKNETLTSWLVVANKLNFNLDSINVKEDKLREIESLIKSGLPTYEFFFYELIDFLQENESVTNTFHMLKDKVVVRFVAKNNSLQRYTFIDKDYFYIKSWAVKNIKEKQYATYKVVINVYDPALYCGVIISSRNRMVIEMVKDENLERLCHGRIIPWHAQFSFDKMHAFRTMQYKEPIPIKVKEILWRITKSILIVDTNESENFPHYIPGTGFYEFVISKQSNALRFIEYKQTNLSTV